jgi:dolichol-phosphate mannosyltransferase
VSAPQISVILPTLNEAANLPLVIPRIAEALAGRSIEILIIDDASTDTTPQVCAEFAANYPLALHVRTHPKDGLSGAVLYGISLAKGQFIVVMDADLQHPPAKLPELLAPLERGEAEFVLGSRYIPGGSMQESWGPFRRINSRVATFLARPFAGRTHDPMSGFFALKRETYERAERLTPLGYKVGLELMCKCRVRNVREIPIHFSSRAHGQSKLTLTQQFKYLEHLSRLYDFYYPRASPMLKFLIATACGWLVAFGPYLAMVMRNADPVAAPVIAYLLTIATTAVFHFRYVRTQRDFIIAHHPWLDFLFISLAELATCWLCALWLANRVPHLRPLELFVIPFGVATVVRYMLRKELMQDVRGLRKDLRTEERK